MIQNRVLGYRALYALEILRENTTIKHGPKEQTSRCDPDQDKAAVKQQIESLITIVDRQTYNRSEAGPGDRNIT